MRMQRHPARDLEEALADAWPAAEAEEFEGWLLRCTGGPSKEANSVATYEATGELELDARIDKAEAWYKERGLSTLFHVGPSATPSELDQALEDRGYERMDETLVLTAEPAQVAGMRVKTAKLETSLAFNASPTFQALLREGEFAGHEESVLGILRQLGTRCRFLVVRDTRGMPLGSAVGITSEDRLGVYALFTLPSARRKGVARAMLQALAQSALADSMRELYVQAEVENAAALALFTQAGFREFYRYHYRSREATGPLARA